MYNGQPRHISSWFSIVEPCQTETSRGFLMPMNGIRPDLEERSFLEDFEMPVVLPESHCLPMIPCPLESPPFRPSKCRSCVALSHAFDLDHDQVASICTMIVCMECVGPSRGVPSKHPQPAWTPPRVPTSSSLSTTNPSSTICTRN
jgi:hypothetical protein